MALKSPYEFSVGVFSFKIIVCLCDLACLDMHTARDACVETAEEEREIF